MRFHDLLRRLLFLVPAAGGVMLLAGPGCGSGTSWGGSSCDDPCPGAAMCDTALGCVECRGDGDCGAAQPFCVLGRCRECAQTGDCAAGQACFPDDHHCHPACAGNGDCPEDKMPLCHPDTGACVGCITDQDCGNKPFCDEVTGKCAECLADGDCGTAAPHCDPSDGECRSCIVDAHCAENEKCSDHHCVLDGPCTQNSQCPDDRLCDVDTGECVRCLTDADCGGGQPFCSKPLDRCVECLLTEQCDAGKTCNAEGKCD